MMKCLMSLFDKEANERVQNRKRVLQTELRRFRNDDGGSILVFSLFLFAMMLMIGGLAVDVMRAEYQRTKIQYTLDRAVLAATSLQQTIPPREVIRDYFEKAGLSKFTPSDDAITLNETSYIDSDTGERRVTKRSVAVNLARDDNTPQIQTIFLGVNWKQIFNIGNSETTEYLATPVIAKAINGVGRIEISLVLDVSGSMGDTSVSGLKKIEDLQIAAKDFVDTMLPTGADLIPTSISIIPYSIQVNAGPTLLDLMSVTSESSYANCVDFTPTQFTTTEINTAVPLQRSGYFVPHYNNDSYNTRRWKHASSSYMNWGYRNCPMLESRRILPFSGDRDELNTYIDALYSSGWTSTEIGIKWGTALLDPSLRPVVDQLIVDGVVNTKFDGQPKDFVPAPDQEKTMKVLVAMTDGANTFSASLKPAFIGGLSNVWHHYDEGQNRHYYWVYNEDRGGNKYLVQKFNKWGSRRDLPNGNRSAWVANPGEVPNYDDDENYTSDAVQLSLPDLYKKATGPFIAFQLQKRAGLSQTTWREAYERQYMAEKDTKMQAICNAARGNGIVVYTIGFEVSNSNAAKLLECAGGDTGSNKHFFRVEGSEISAAFAEIAAQLKTLRLTQ